MWLQVAKVQLDPEADNGKPQYITSQIEDITERKRAQEALQEEQLFRSVFEMRKSESVSSILIDRQSAPNHALQEMLGYTEAELGQLERWDEISHPDERAAAAERYLNLFMESAKRTNGNSGSFAKTAGLPRRA